MYVSWEDAYTATCVCTCAHCLSYFCSIGNPILNLYAGNSPCGRTGTVEITVQTQTVLILVLIKLAGKYVRKALLLIL